MSKVQLSQRYFSECDVDKACEEIPANYNRLIITKKLIAEEGASSSSSLLESELRRLLLSYFLMELQPQLCSSDDELV